MAKGLVYLAAFALFAIIVLASCIRRRSAYPNNSIGFVHPAAFAGGGGERVLWLGIEAIMKEDNKKNVARQYVLYCLKDDTAESGENANDLHLKKIERQFGTKIPAPLHYVYLPKKAAYWLEGSSYPFATLLFQTIVGGCILFYYCAIVSQATPIIVESVGIPMVYPLFRVFCNSVVIAYVHYPIISSDMTDMVKRRERGVNNSDIYRKNSVLRCGKVLYYYSIMLFYRFLGQFPQLVLTNSSWTNNHIKRLFSPRKTNLLYPPCPVKESCRSGQQSPSLNAAARRNRIASIGQFRPEKNHPLQLQAFSKALPHLPSDATLAFFGGCRNAADKQRVENLKALAAELKIEEKVEFHINEPFEVLQQELQTSLIGLHGMRNEHFGIVIVEYLAAGCIVLAHRSGGVALDIVKSPELGSLAETEEEYAEAMKEIFKKKEESPEVLDVIRSAGCKHALSFDDSVFQTKFIALVKDLLWLPQKEEAKPVPKKGFPSFEEYAATKQK